jgi:hypothetical protein
VLTFPKKTKRTRCSRKTKLRQQAAHRECQVRLHGCLGEPTVLAHVRLVGVSGMGIKAPDVLGAWACDSCHRKYDTRGSGRGADDIELEFLRGVMRTIDTLVSEGAIEVRV